MKKKTSDSEVIFCITCKVDLRPKNKSVHEIELGHDVQIMDHDPRIDGKYLIIKD